MTESMRKEFLTSIQFGEGRMVRELKMIAIEGLLSTEQYVG